MFYDERVVIVAEQRPDASEEDSFQWMSRVLQVHHLQSHSSSLILNSLAVNLDFSSKFGFLLVNQVIFVGFFFNHTLECQSCICPVGY